MPASFPALPMAVSLAGLASTASAELLTQNGATIRPSLGVGSTCSDSYLSPYALSAIGTALPGNVFAFHARRSLQKTST
ncbi:hypothetical protein [Pacificoceanicola onchidii]|uniref:hypothetical protein n=1 Tax=Pacificoceanicola onchidii TaxID=2562685 RepID=UPI0010A42107|nr:hypothetical protein [Pacificoceanicola onchidii]